MIKHQQDKFSPNHISRFSFRGFYLDLPFLPRSVCHRFIDKVAGRIFYTIENLLLPTGLHYAELQRIHLIYKRELIGFKMADLDICSSHSTGVTVGRRCARSVCYGSWLRYRKGGKKTKLKRTKERRWRNCHWLWRHLFLWNLAKKVLRSWCFSLDKHQRSAARYHQ